MPRMGYAAGIYDDGEEEEEEGPAAPVVNPYTNKNTESANEEVAKETSPAKTVGTDENATAGDKNKSLLEGKTMTRRLRNHLRMTILATMMKTTTTILPPVPRLTKNPLKRTRKMVLRRRTKKSLRKILNLMKQ